MHDSMMAQVGMDHEHHSGTHENNGYGSNEGWVDMNHNYNSPQQHQSPTFEHGGYGFMSPSGHHGMPMEPASFHSPMIHHSLPTTSSHQPLIPLVTNHSSMHPTLQPTWPSMLTHPQVYSSPPVAIPAVPAPLVKGNGNKSLAIHTTPAPRKTLTDADRTRMCQYHEAHPTVKQTEIGAKFGVERSTVSKVLRQKEKYLFPEDRNLSPVKRTKGGKHPDVERGLSVWLKKQCQQGIPLTDAAIREKAQFFLATVDSGSASQIKLSNPTWLEKFKQKNGFNGGKLTRRASETNISDNNSRSQLESNGPSASQTPNDISPTSPNLLPSPSPLSGTKSDDELKPESMNSYFSFNSTGSSRYKHSNSQSTTSLSSNFTDHGPQSFSAGPTSPTTPFAFSPDSSTAPWQLSVQGRNPPASNAFQRPRSQTFPMLGIDPAFISTHTNEPLTPKYNLPVTAPPSSIDSPLNEMAPHFGMDSAISSPHLHHSSSNGSMGPPTSGTPLTGLQSPSSSATSSPTTQDEARRALDTLLNFFQQAPNGFVEQHEYMTLLKLTDKLRIQQQSALPGGLHRIAEQEGEVAPKMEQSMSADC